MSKKKGFETLLLEAGAYPILPINSIVFHSINGEFRFVYADQPLKRSKRHKRHKKSKTEQFSQSTISLTTDSSMDTINETIDIEEELCVVEIPMSIDLPSASDSSYVEMSAAEKLKSQTFSPAKGGAMTPIAGAAASKVAKKKKTRRDSGTSSEEERWLDAIESGKLEQVDDELKKIKDPKLMTARQRAMYERSIDKDQSLVSDSLQALPTGYKEKILTAEAMQKAALKSQKRKQLADEKREKDKKKTMDRLLKKQETKATKVNKNKSIKVTVPLISYRDSIHEGTFLTFPPLEQYPVKAYGPIESPKPIACAVCTLNTKRYNCAKTNAPLCSFKCYKINIQSIEKIVC